MTVHNEKILYKYDNRWPKLILIMRYYIYSDVLAVRDNGVIPEHLGLIWMSKD